jgi:hypothetical protein
MDDGGVTMTITEFLAQLLKSEAPISRCVLERVDEGRADQ